MEPKIDFVRFWDNLSETELNETQSACHQNCKAARLQLLAPASSPLHKTHRRNFQLTSMRT